MTTMRRRTMIWMTHLLRQSAGPWPALCLLQSGLGQGRVDGGDLFGGE